MKLLLAIACAALIGVAATLALAGGPERVVVAAPAASAPTPTATFAPVPAPAVGDDDQPLFPEEARRAAAAAVRSVGGGTAVELDRSDDPGEAYEIEVIKDGQEYDVALDLDFQPVPNRRYDDEIDDD